MKVLIVNLGNSDVYSEGEACNQREDAKKILKEFIDVADYQL